MFYSQINWDLFYNYLLFTFSLNLYLIKPLEEVEFLNDWLLLKDAKFWGHSIDKLLLNNEYLENLLS